MSPLKNITSTQNHRFYKFSLIKYFKIKKNKVHKQIFKMKKIEFMFIFYVTNLKKKQL